MKKILLKDAVKSLAVLSPFPARITNFCINRNENNTGIELER
jgi:hypothetical protein